MDQVPLPCLSDGSLRELVRGSALEINRRRSEGDLTRVAFDVGGTFTDLVFLGTDGKLTAIKFLSVLESVGTNVRGLIGRAENPVFVHATTIASNSLIEGKAGKVALITTRGFRDVLEMRNQRRPSIPDVFWRRSPPLVPRALRFELDERILGDGTVERDLDVSDVAEAANGSREAGVAAIAVCLINSYLNSRHEHKVRELLSTTAPELLITLSSEIFPQAREYERTSTTCVNAALIPVLDDYLLRLEKQLEVSPDDLLIMQSSGGLVTSRAVRQRPIQIIESGPAAGVMAAAKLAEEVGLEKVISFDMGGTTAKASTILESSPVERPESEIGGDTSLATRFFGGQGHAVIAPSIDIAEVGAGGGSIAWIENGEVLRVGPVGAGADPGPVCYGRGGESPTVTDADVVLGFINPHSIADSSVPIDREAAFKAIQEKIARPLRLDVDDAAYGVVQVANTIMGRALRAVSVEKGQDPRNFVLVASGGAGPVHAALLAESLGILKIYVPPYPGLFSAIGLLLANFRYDIVKSVVTTLDDFSYRTYEGALQELEFEILANLRRQRVAPEDTDLRVDVKLQYRYQDSSVEVEPRRHEISKDNFNQELGECFQRLHEKEFGYRRRDPIDVVSMRIRAEAPAPAGFTFAQLTEHVALRGKKALENRTTSRSAYFGPNIGVISVPLLRRKDLVGRQETGPMIIEEPDTSVVVPPAWDVTCDTFSNLVLSRREA